MGSHHLTVDRTLATDVRRLGGQRNAYAVVSATSADSRVRRAATAPRADYPIHSQRYSTVTITLGSRLRPGDSMLDSRTKQLVSPRRGRAAKLDDEICRRLVPGEEGVIGRVFSHTVSGSVEM
jgi:hypothetical protein